MLAYRGEWLERFDARTGWVWLAGGLLGVVALFVVGADAACLAPGGSRVQAVLWATYESGLCVALCVGLLTLFREAVTGGGRLAREASAAAYTVYLVHLPLVAAVQYYLSGRGLAAAGAWVVTCAVAIPCALLLSAGLRRLPGARRVW
ncbi:acyltransferase family protein [Streptomyces sp. NBC_00441]|uniref:acyltransferase family protein n=1 Tax=Streptomyces sp. NBC_00441 TaxID=2975742 RepID=UPI002E2BA411|nr:acyltransferase family protein [Streptomyces sp. NBC_00441]